MTRLASPDLYPDVRPLGLLAHALPFLRRLKVLAYLSIALLLFAVFGSVLPLGTWLLLTLCLATPTIASLVLVASD